MIKADGTVWCWGDNSLGQLGDGLTHQSCQAAGYTDDCSPTPVQVPGISGVVSVVAGAGHVCALLGDGAVWCWGLNAYGQTGSSSIGTTTTPVKVGGLAKVVSIAAGDGHSCAVQEDGTAWCWGDNRDGQLGDGSSADKLSQHQACTHPDGNTIDGTVRCWGDDTYGELGDHDTPGASALHTNCSSMPAVTLDCVRTPVEVAGLADVVGLGAALDATCALKKDATVWCWGSDTFGQLGDGATKTTPVLDPVQVTGLPEVVALSTDGACAVARDGTVWCWGAIVDSAVPVQISGQTGAVDTSMGGAHGCDLLGDGTVRCWGADDYGQCGSGSPEPQALYGREFVFPQATVGA